MTEKQYGGSSKFGAKSKVVSNTKTQVKEINNKSSSNADNSDSDFNIEKIIQAGKIASQVKIFAREFIKPGLSLLEIAEKIESQISKLGGKPAFPVSLSINEVAAHSTPSFNDTSVASGLLKVDLGVSISGFISDTAFSVDLENSEENKSLINAAETALKNAVECIALNISLNEIGKTIDKTSQSLGFLPIRNLSGHSISKYELHAGITIPNFASGSTQKIPSGLYAIEPFTTLSSGSALVRDGKPSGIYHLENASGVRDSFAREVLDFIVEEYNTLPFCSRWIYKKFGSRGLLALRQIEQSGCLHHYKQLVETSGSKVAQAEQTVLLTEKDKIITTL